MILAMEFGSSVCERWKAVNGREDRQAGTLTAWVSGACLCRYRYRIEAIYMVLHRVEMIDGGTVSCHDIHPVSIRA